MTDADVVRQLTSAREGLLLWVRSDLSTLVIEGPDRQSWLNGLVTCDLAKLSAGDAAYGVAVNKGGKIQTELVILVGAERLLVAVPRDRSTALAATFEGYLIMEDAELRVDAELEWLWGFGPRARDALGPAATASGAAWGSIRRGGLDGVAVAAAAGAGDRIREQVEASLGEIARPATPEGWRHVRVAHGIAEMGVDFDDGNYPQEAGLERDGVSFDKGCYLGQETVFMLEKRGHVKNRIVQLEVEGDDELSSGTPVTDEEGLSIGSVTSAVPATTGAGWIALAWVKYKYARAGRDLHVAGRRGRVTERLAIPP